MEIHAGSIAKIKRECVAARKDWFIPVLKAAAFLDLILVAFVIISLLSKTSVQGMTELFSNLDTVTSIVLSVVSVLISAVLVLIIGLPAAFYLARARKKIYGLLENIIYLPMVFPPAVTGLALLAAFGRNSLIGRGLGAFDILLPFSFAGVVLVQVFVTLPSFIQIVRNGFASVDIAVEESAKVFGAGESQLLFHIYIPMARPAILSAMIMCMLRAAGEFGATIMFAGNLAGRTQTMTTRIYSLFQMDIGQAVCLAVIQLFVFILPLVLLKMHIKEVGE